MAVYIVTGKLGNGKTLCSVGRIRDKLRAGCIVASNIDLNLVHMFGSQAKNLQVLRIPDKPTVDDLDMIGNGNLSYDESKNGLLVLDECGTWFNSRNWQDKSRQKVNDWFLHARKLGWDVLLIVQDISLIDSQAREALSEHTVFCKRIDNLSIPVIGTLFKALTGSKLKLPRVHVARVVYGTSIADLLSDRWVYRGTDLFACYDTKQLFLSNYPHGVFSALTPWHLKGRYQRPRDREFYMRMTKIVWRRFRSPVAMAAGVLVGVAIAAASAFGFAYRDFDRKNSAAPIAAVPVPIVAKNPEPGFLEGRSAYIVANNRSGDSIDYVVSVRDAGRSVTLSMYQLAQLGYAVRPVDQCLVELRRQDKTHFVMCSQAGEAVSVPSAQRTDI